MALGVSASFMCFVVYLRAFRRLSVCSLCPCAWISLIEDFICSATERRMPMNGVSDEMRRRWVCAETRVTYVDGRVLVEGALRAHVVVEDDDAHHHAQTEDDRARVAEPVVHQCGKGRLGGAGQGRGRVRGGAGRERKGRRGGAGPAGRERKRCVVLQTYRAARSGSWTALWQMAAMVESTSSTLSCGTLFCGAQAGPPHATAGSARSAHRVALHRPGSARTEPTKLVVAPTMAFSIGVGTAKK